MDREDCIEFAQVLRAHLDSEELTYCDGCKRFSRGVVCPFCKPEGDSDG